MVASTQLLTLKVKFNSFADNLLKTLHKKSNLLNFLNLPTIWCLRLRYNKKSITLRCIGDYIIVLFDMMAHIIV